MGNIIIGVIIAFIISFYAIPIIIQFADQIKLYDHPDERKVHKNPIPSLGGLGIFIGFMMGLLLTQNIPAVSAQLQYFFASFLVVFFFGVKDDILKIKPMKKILGQLLAGIIIIFKANLLFTNFQGFLGVTYIIPSFGVLFTLLTIMVIMNAFNLIDGIDGLAASLGILTSCTFGVFFYLSGDMFYSTIGFILASSLFAFLTYNYSPAKIFMGDTGSMLIGLINAILVIRFIETAPNTNFFPKLTSTAMGFGILAVPLLDTLRVFGIRILHGQSPFYPDRRHLHHILLDRGFNHVQILYTLVSISVLITVGTFYILPIGCTYTIVAQLVFFFLGVYLLTKFIPEVKKKAPLNVEKIVEPEFISTSSNQILH